MTSTSPTNSVAEQSLPLLRAAVAVVTMGGGLAIGAFAGGLLAGDGDGFAARILPAALVGLVVVSVVLLLRRFWDRRPLAGIGLTGAAVSARSFALGLGVPVVCGGATVAVASLVGAISWNAIDASTLLTFLATNAAVAILFEALPEEVSIRGYALAALRSRYGRGASAVIATVAFLAMPLVALTTQALLTRLVSAPPSPFAIAPPGQDPLTYYAMLTGFSVMLLFAREATVSASIWTCVGAHLAFLTINRVLLDPRRTGIEMDYADPVLAAIFAVYLTASVIVFVILRGRAEARAESRSL